MASFTTSILLFFLLLIGLLQLGGCHKAYPNVSCIARERRALLQLRNSFVDKSNRLSSWSGEDCCNWEGVGCSNSTGHVVKLDLRNLIIDDHPISDPNYRNNCLGGEINPSVLTLEHLHYLDLSGNNFSGIPIPLCFGSLKNLRYLNLSCSGFRGEIPHHLGNLSDLQHLNLVRNSLTSKSLSWVSKLYSLKSLDLSWVDLRGAQDWIQSINMLPSLLSLKLEYCQLYYLPPLLYVNLTSLTLLDLSGNYFNSTIPLWLFNNTSLRHVDLSFNNFHGAIPGIISQLTSLALLELSGNKYMMDPLPNSFGSLSSLEHLGLSYNNFGGSLPLGQLRNLTSLTVLDLSDNQFQGAIPREIGHIRRLTKLNLSRNKLNGTIPSSLWLLRMLEYMDISSNSLIGEISEVHFAQLQKLKSLYLSQSSLTLNVRSSWIPPFQLQSIQLDSTKIGPHFPSWLKTQKHLQYLSMSNASISDNIPDWFWIVYSGLYSLDLSKNFIVGPIPQPEGFENSVSWSSLYLNDNYFNGSIPASICQIKILIFLDLSNNQLSGRLPFCLGNLRNLMVLNLANNNLFGQIPSSLGYIELLQSLDLNRNNFGGELPKSFRYLKYMQFLDLGENKLEGIIPAWIGKHLSIMRILRLRSNNFYGDVSLHLCQLSKLLLLDLAQNNLTGRIPRCFNNFSAMGLNYSQLYSFGYYTDPSMRSLYLHEEMLLSFMGGRELEYSKDVLAQLTSLDLSHNNLVGEIPTELMDLVGLRSLNMTRNRLSGKIPEKIGNLRNLQSLDLSSNELFGLIPSSMANLTSLSSLNLSSNKLFGRIPTGNQLQTLNDPSIYAGNDGLCGKPLPNSCTDDNSSKENGIILGEKTPFSWFYAGLGPGFGVGFVGIFSILLLKKSWRYAYFQLAENISKDICVWIALKISKLQRKL